MGSIYQRWALMCAVSILIFAAALSAQTNVADANQPKQLIEKRFDLSDAARRNARLKYTLVWSFSGRKQRGWYLYIPLIKELIDCDDDEWALGFARQVFAWQKKNGLRRSGVIDRKTLFSFIAHWQSRRIKPIFVADQDTLVAAPITEFFDQTRDAELLMLEKKTYAAYKNMFAAFESERAGFATFTEKRRPLFDKNFLKIISAYRSPAYQASLRAKEPNAGRGKLAFRSPHFTGRALDIHVGGELVKTIDANRAIQVRTLAYRWLVKNADRFGFYPYFYEPWHWEFVPQNTLRPQTELSD